MHIIRLNFFGKRFRVLDTVSGAELGQVSGGAPLFGPAKRQKMRAETKD